MNGPNLAILLLVAAGWTTTDPGTRAVVQEAVAAVEGDSVDVLETRWRILERDPANRSARLGLATLERLTFRTAEAESSYQAILGAAEVPDAAAGYAALGMSRILLDRGDRPAAESVAERALSIGRVLADSALTSEALVQLASARLRTSGPAAALPLLQEAESLAPHTELRTRAFTRCIHAFVLRFLSDPRSLDLAFEGLEMADQVGDRRLRVECLHAIGAEYERREDPAAALHFYDEAVRESSAAGDLGRMARAMQWRSSIHTSKGHFALAQRDAEQAIRTARVTGHDAIIPWAQGILAHLNLRVGDAEAAVHHATAAFTSFSRQGDRFSAMWALGLEGRLRLMTGDPAGARKAFDDLVHLSEEVAFVGGLYTGRIGLVETALAEDDLEEARRELARARPLAQTSGMSSPARAFGYFEGVVALRGGDFSEAERLFRRRFERSREPESSRTDGYVEGTRLAEALARQNRIEEAVQVLRSATDALDEWRTSLENRKLRALAFQFSEDHADPDLGFAMIISSLAQAERYHVAFELVERRRARDLMDQLNRATAFDTSATDRVLPHVTPTTLDELQRLLPDDETAILEFVTGRGDPTTLLVVTRDAVHSYELASEDSLRQPIARLVAYVESGHDPRPLARKLGRLLLAQALSDLNVAVHRLIVVPDGPLHRLPFDVLVMPDGRFLAEGYAVATAPSAGFLVKHWSGQPRDAPMGVAVLADPLFGDPAHPRLADIEDLPLQQEPVWRLVRLVHTSAEARVVARHASGALVLRRAAASEAWLKETPLEQFGVLHFATHALVDERSIARTALALAPSDGEDGFVGPADLAALNLAAELVVLSACRTAGGVLIRGEGVQGLAVPLLSAGARAVAATWWPVSDETAVRMMNDFYRSLAGGHGAGDALRTAKIRALERGAPANEWTAFTLIGDPFALPRLTMSRSGISAAFYAGRTAFTAAVMLILGAFVGWMWRHTRARARRIATHLK